MLVGHVEQFRFIGEEGAVGHYVRQFLCVTFASDRKGSLVVSPVNSR